MPARAEPEPSTAASMVGLAFGILLVLGAASQRFGSLWAMASMMEAGAERRFERNLAETPARRTIFRATRRDTSGFRTRELA
jgi:hypothetical protein